MHKNPISIITMKSEMRPHSYRVYSGYGYIAARQKVSKYEIVMRRRKAASGCNLLKNAMFINQHEVQVIVSKFLNFQVAQREVHSLVVV